MAYKKAAEKGQTQRNKKQNEKGGKRQPQRKNPPKKGIKPGFWVLYIAAVILIFIIFCAAMLQTLGAGYNLKTQKTELETQIAQEKERHAELSMEGDYYKSDAYYEKVAREKLGLVMPNEIIFIDNNK